MESKKVNHKKLIRSFLKKAYILGALWFCVSASAQDEKTINTNNHHRFSCGVHQTPGVNSIQRTEIKKGDAVLPENIVELESLPGANHVIYLDFDGEPHDSDGPYFTPYDWTNEEITKVWEIVAEDYAPFNINVTTKRELYDVLPNNKRVKVIFTSISDVSVTGVGGTASLDTFGTDSPGHPIIYVKDGNTASHEVGHTMGLDHDTYTDESGKKIDEYYDGHNNWGAIMGGGFGEVEQWSKGEYNSAGNKEDDLAIIARDKNGFGYRTDDHGDVPNQATVIVPDTQGNVIVSRNKGIIEKNTDKDVFSFTTIGGDVELFFRSPFKKVIGFWDNSNLNIKVRLLDSNGTEIMYSDPEGLEANITTNLQAGTYYLEIDGVGEGENPSVGYSDYASLGHYVISGKYPIDPTETEAPSTPTNLVASNITQTSLTIEWEASVDNTAVEGYEIFKGNQLLTTVEGTSGKIKGLSRDTTYELKVRAKDIIGNLSGFSTLTIRTAEIPSGPTDLKAFDITTGSLTLSWTKSIDYTEVVAYNIYKNDELIGAVNDTSYNVTGLNFGTDYLFKIAAKDAIGNLSELSSLNIRTGAYCKNGFNLEFTEDINHVQLGEIDNTSNGSPGYEDYTNLSTTLSKGINHTIIITPFWSGAVYEEGYSVWIDYNQDGDFEDEGEQVWAQAPTKDSSVSGDFVVPNNALNGSTRMRVAMKAGGIPKSCEALDYGEVEDYTVIISNETTCTDGIQNGDETGVDCGGSSCEPCQVEITYCDMKGNNSNDDNITNITFAGINKTSSDTTAGYHNYTDNVANVAKGASENMIVTFQGWSGGNDDEVYVWIDWNQDGDFTDADEKFEGTGTGTSRTVTIVTPNTASNGATRMRVVLGYENTDGANACTNIRYGEVEDYTITINEGVTPTCTDGIQNGNETGIDCGGDSCEPCIVAATCDDGIQNGDETGIDCGGTSCAPCVTSETVVYVDMDDKTANSSSTWNTFRIEVGDNQSFGVWRSANTIRLVTYGKDIVCEGATNHITFLNEGVEVGANSNFVADGNSHIVSSSSHTSWNGKSGYIGFTFKINGATHYGWFYATVSNDGTSYTIKDYAYNTTGGQGLITKRPTTLASSLLSSPEINNKVNVYPNPFTESLTLDVSRLPEERFVIKMFNTLGEEIFSNEYDKNTNSVTIGNEITLLGVYFVKISTATYSETLQVIKQ